MVSSYNSAEQPGKMTAARKKTVVVLGVSYGGAYAACNLSRLLPKCWRVICIDRNTHFNHLYALPRFAVVPGHEHEAFIPYQPMLPRTDDPTSAAQSIILHAHVTSLTPNSVTLSRAFPEHGIHEPAKKLDFDYVIYALGSHLPAPINLWDPLGDNPGVLAVTKGLVRDAGKCQPRTGSYQGTKLEGIDWLRMYRRRIEKASSILVVGGGPLGVQYSTDIKERHPEKHVALLHSRAQLLPTFVKAMHDEIMSTLDDQHIDTILGDRLDLASVKEGRTVTTPDGRKERVVRTISGRELRAELILLCTGQVPNTGLLADAIPCSIITEGQKKGQARVARTMQVGIPSSRKANGNGSISCALNGLSLTEPADGDGEPLRIPYPHFFAVGDAVDAFGANNAGRNSYYQCEVAVKNIVKLIESAGTGVELEEYEPRVLAQAIKITLGTKKQLVQDAEGNAIVSNDGVEDLRVKTMWDLFGVPTDDMHR